MVAFLLPQSEEALSDLSPQLDEQEDDFLSDLAVFLVPSALGFFSLLKISTAVAAPEVAATTLVAERANTKANTVNAAINFFMMFCF